MIRTGAWDLGCDTDVFFSAATCEGDDDGQGDACVLNADGSGCAVDGGDCEYTPASGSVGGARAFHAREGALALSNECYATAFLQQLGVVNGTCSGEC